MTTATHTFITADGLLTHWQGHQRLTRRVLEAFPEDKLFDFTPAPPMRSFGALALEIIGMIEPTLHGLQTGTWETPDLDRLRQTRPTKAELLTLYDKTARALHEEFPKIPEASFYETHTAFGQWKMPGSELIFYLYRQRNPSPRAGLRLPSAFGDRTTRVLRAVADA